MKNLYRFVFFSVFLFTSLYLSAQNECNGCGQCLSPISTSFSGVGSDIISNLCNDDPLLINIHSEFTHLGAFSFDSEDEIEVKYILSSNIRFELFNLNDVTVNVSGGDCNENANFSFFYEQVGPNSLTELTITIIPNGGECFDYSIDAVFEMINIVQPPVLVEERVNTFLSYTSVNNPNNNPNDPNDDTDICMATGFLTIFNNNPVVDAIISTIDNPIEVSNGALPAGTVEVNPFQIVSSLDVDINTQFNGHDGADITECYMWAGSNIEVTNGAELFADFYEFIPCSGAEWDNITIHDGSVVFDNCEFSGAINPLIFKTGTSGTITNCTFFDYDRIIIEGNAAVTFDNCTFRDAGIGVQTASRNVVFKNCTFLNCTTGIFQHGSAQLNINDSSSPNSFIDNTSGLLLNGTNANIQFQNFEDNSFGIISQNDGFTVLDRNTFNGDNRAIRAVTGNYRISFNEIGQESLCREGIFVNSAEADIIRNNMNCSLSGVKLKNAINVEVLTNDIIVSGNNSVRNNGIEAINSDATIEGNTVRMQNGQNGIRSVGSDGIQIQSNTVIGSHLENGIRIERSASVLIEENDVSGNLNNGVFMIESADGTVECNTIDANSTGLWMSKYCSGTQVLTNILEGNNRSYLLSSVLGVSLHQGNAFIGCVESTIAGNILVVDPSLHSDFLPNCILGFIVISTTDFNNETEFCANGPQFEPHNLAQDPDKICDILKRVNSLKERSKNKDAYLIQMYHILKHYLKNIPEREWPECLKKEMEKFKECGLLEIVKEQIRFENTGIKRETSRERGETTDEKCGDVIKEWERIKVLYESLFKNDRQKKNLSSATGTNSLSQRFNFEVYPNPVNDLLNISLDAEYENVQIEVYNVDGRQVLIERSTQTANVSISTSELNAGTYFLRVVTEENNLEVKRFIVQK